ncbi:hypothetical protein ABKV19_001613 [Rosa sericea]
MKIEKSTSPSSPSTIDCQIPDSEDIESSQQQEDKKQEVTAVSSLTAGFATAAVAVITSLLLSPPWTSALLHGERKGSNLSVIL